MTQERPVRVRFAPSPTGAPHIGNFRTTLFDWLLARHTGGTFILRIEDTDRTRYVEGAVEGIMEAMRWLGLDWDEGPDKDGDYGPYIQSQRLPLYHGATLQLLESGYAYHCFCSPERLDALRAQQREAKVPPGYDGRCSTDAGRAEAEAESNGRPPVVRFRMPDEGETVFTDFLRGDLSFENRLLDDFVIVKSDGFPTYHLAHVVDDHFMEITHIIRGEEWLSSAPRHKLLFQALGYELPEFVHVPLILGPDRSKLSKRHGAQQILDYRDLGYLPDAVFNFLGLMGWSLDDKTEIMSRQDFVDNFTLDRLLKSPAVFNIDKLNWMNGVYMRAMPVEELARLVIDWLEKPEANGGLPDTIARPLDLEYTARIIPYIRERVKLLPEARDMMEFFYHPAGIEPDPQLLLGKRFADDHSRAQLVLQEAIVACERVEEWKHEAILEALDGVATYNEIKRGDFLGMIRIAITGRSVAPPLTESMEILGRDRCVLRLREAVNAL
ncbi:MAG: glutamate--tRNA ligase [Dehalococcoidia bacterium]